MYKLSVSQIIDFVKNFLPGVILLPVERRQMWII